jgi:hypothetical protein
MRPASGDPEPVTHAAGSGSPEQSAGLAGCGPEFLLLEIEIMRLEGVVEIAEPEANEAQG